MSHSDFDNDGFDDLAIGVPGEDNTAGAVNVLFGSTAGLAAARDQIWAQHSPGVEGNPQTGNRFGDALGVGDFDNDGFDDLAIGVPGEDNTAGAVNVLHGSTAGLTAAGDQIWGQVSPGVEGNPQTGNRFGDALGVGDFDNDGFDDLAIGVPGEDNTAGAVNVLFGSTAGLTGAGDQIWAQHSPGVEGNPQTGNRFGDALGVGDFDNDGFDDLAIGVPGEDNTAGAVNVLHGSTAGLTAAGDQIWGQVSPGVEGNPQTGNRFGDALGVGDFDNDGFDDLAIGVPGEDNTAGAVNVLHGSTAGLTAAGDQIWGQVSPGVEGGAESGDRFGSALASGDFNNDGFDDLAIGVPGEDTGERTQDGGVNVLYGSAEGLQATGSGGPDDRLWGQDSPGVEGNADSFDFFGEALTVGDFDNDGFDDLAIGVPGEDTGFGAANVLFGSAAGLTAAGDQIWAQHSHNIDGLAEAGDLFGFALA